MEPYDQSAMTHGSLFAGIGGFDLGFQKAGFNSRWAVEIEPFCQAVLRTKFPKTEILTDVKECGKHNLGAVDVVTAGFPCQDLSVAGKRAGLEGDRSGLFWELRRILGELTPPWFVIENVPGLFSSNEGRDFGIVLQSLDELGYGLAWRVLDSQYFGVAQRRRRVFIVGCFGKPCPEEILFEPEGSSGDIAQGERAWENLAAAITSGVGRVGSNGCEGPNIVGPLKSSAGGGWIPNAEEAADGHIIATARLAPALTQRDYKGTRCDTSSDSNRVRNFARLPKGMDSPRYRALGNAVTASVAEWIARRISAYSYKLTM